MKLEHLRWPFFDETHRKRAAEFSEWTTRELAVHERNERNDGRVATKIFEALGQSGWLRKTLPVASPSRAARIDLRKNMHLARNLRPLHRTIKGGIGHNPPQEAPQAFAQAVVDVDNF